MASKVVKCAQLKSMWPLYGQSQSNLPMIAAYLQDLLDNIIGVDVIHLLFDFCGFRKALKQGRLNQGLIQVFHLLGTVIHLVKILHHHKLHVSTLKVSRECQPKSVTVCGSIIDR